MSDRNNGDGNDDGKAWAMLMATRMAGDKDGKGKGGKGNGDNDEVGKR